MRSLLVAAVIAAVWAYFFMWRTVSVRSHAAGKTLVVWLEMDGSASRQLVLDAGARDSTIVWGRPSRDTALGVFALQSGGSNPIGSCGHQGRWSPASDYIVIVTEPEEGELIAWCERASALDAVLSAW
ncbi:MULTISPECIES: hypothetical protein [Sorangium]|uniref:hypothetical protein n=1 Tax=Sorangium TaxID=39643 RepID=UPI00101A6495|nr:MULTISPECIES: hypothetical protein [Sorangium]WCQ97531.1 hypothetical protein NQZ70_10325 [Sorangium sp. Soce836]